MPPPEPAPGGKPSAPVSYELRLVQTAASTGYFAAVPAAPPPLEEALAYLRKRPLDEFMHRHLMGVVAGAEQQIDRLFKRLEDPLIYRLLAELAAGNRDVAARWEKSAGIPPGKADFRHRSSLIDLCSCALSDQELHRRWTALFSANRRSLSPVPEQAATGLAAPVSEAALSAIPSGRGIEAMPSPASDPADNSASVSPEEAAGIALERLQRAGLLSGPELRHQTSLCPLGLLRKWRLDLSVDCGRHRYRLCGEQTGYGRGFSLETARVRCLMEIVERCSAFAGVSKDRVRDRSTEMRLFHGPCGNVPDAGGMGCLDPNRIRLEVPYGGEPLYWVCGTRVDEAGEAPLLVPFQTVFLFSNLDEVSLFSGLSSTGLAAGTTITGARLSALLEVVERDSDAVSLFDPGRCFRLQAEDAFVSGLLKDYRARGIDVFFQEITGFTGLPCFKAYVCGADGVLHTGTGAHPDGRYALLSAMTEVPYPYPNGPPSGRVPEDLPVRILERIPNRSAGLPSADLSRIEQVLLKSGFCPIYVEITRRDLSLPVVRALVPGLEIMADFDRFSRVCPRLFVAYRSLPRRGLEKPDLERSSGPLKRVCR